MRKGYSTGSLKQSGKWVSTLKNRYLLVSVSCSPTKMRCTDLIKWIAFCSLQHRQLCTEGGFWTDNQIKILLFLANFNNTKKLLK